jgi:protoporphyrin/coproporphyrin ferrochelatase
MDEAIGLLVMAYGTASGPDDIERYYTDIRGGRVPTPEHLDELVERYAAIGNRFPLLDITSAQASGLAQALTDIASERYRPYLGMKHSSPSIDDGLAHMRADGIERAVGIVMAPHWSGMSVETYVQRVEAGVARDGGPTFTFVRHWHDHPKIVAFLASRVSAALERLSGHEREGVHVLFTAHSLPTRTLEDGSLRCLRCDAPACAQRCTYWAQLRETADLVARALPLRSFDIAWQSAGRTADPWWGPPVEDAIRDADAAGHPAVLVCSVGFVSDHLEILFDLDIEAHAIADEEGITFVRTEMPNSDPGFLSALAQVVCDHVAAVVSPERTIGS